MGSTPNSGPLCVESISSDLYSPERQQDGHEMARLKSATVDLKVRMKEPLRAKIARSAKGHGISLNAEVVRRLEQSFFKEDAREQEWGGADTLSLMRVFASLASAVAEREDRNWLDDEAPFDQAVAGFGLVLRMFQPKPVMGENVAIKETRGYPTFRDNYGAKAAAAALRRYADDIDPSEDKHMRAELAEAYHNRWYEVRSRRRRFLCTSIIFLDPVKPWYHRDSSFVLWQFLSLGLGDFASSVYHETRVGMEQSSGGCVRRRFPTRCNELADIRHGSRVGNRPEC